MGDEGLVIIGVTDEPPELVDEWVRDLEPAYPIVSLKSKALEEHLQVKGFPTAAVIDTSGKISFLDHFGYEDALDAALEDADEIALWPKAFKKVRKEVVAMDLVAAYEQLDKVLGKRLEDDERAFGERAKAWLETEAAAALSQGRALAEAGNVYAAMQLVEPYLDTKTPFPNQQELQSLVDEVEARPNLRDELKASEMYVEAKALARSKRTVGDAIEILDKLVAKYDASEVPVVNVARDLLDSLEKYRDD